FRRDRSGDQGTYIFLRRPDVTQVHFVAVNVGPYWVFGQVDIHSTGQGVGNYQWWRGQEACPYLWMNTAFKVAIAAEYCRDNEIVLLHGIGHRLRQRATIANAIVNRYCACHEGMEIAHRQVEHRSPTS